jgi:biopolymer transport protein ExbD
MSGSRKGISLDMTAMCDMAFLLLTFFILTAKMKTPEPIQVDIPASISTLKVPETEMLKISVSDSGAVFISIGEKPVREKMIAEISKNYNLGLSEKEINQFSQIEMFGLPFSQIKGYLSVPEYKRKEVVQQGIPIDTSADSPKNELRAWIRQAKLSNPKMRIAIKGDKNSDYQVYSGVVATLQDLNLNKFSLITTLEGKPKE